MKKLLLLFASVLWLQAAVAQQSTTVVFKYQNKVRPFIVHTPPGYDGTQRLPLVINMHGLLMTGKWQMNYTQMNKTADRENFIVVYPYGIDRRWNTGTVLGLDHPYDDLGFLQTIVDYMTFIYNIDPSRAYSTGFSAGGYMSLQLACDVSSRFAAVAPIAANMQLQRLAECDPARKMPVLFINGLADGIVPITGNPGYSPPVADVIRFWTNNDQCDPFIPEDTLPNINQMDQSRVTLQVFPPCAGSSIVKFYKVLNGGHTWPGSDWFPVLGNVNKDIKANDEIWNFFSEYTVPAELTVGRPISGHISISPLDPGNYRVSWQAVEGASSYEVIVFSPAAKWVTRYPTSATSIDISVSDPLAKWSVASIAASGYKDWSVAQPLPAGVQRLASTVSQLYPNPATDKVFISGNWEKAVITDLSGRVISGLANEGGGSISVDGFQRGIYLLSLKKADGNTETHKLFIQ